jgi:hypothetical protein
VRNDEFPEHVKRVLAARAGHRCCYPACGAPTSGPQLDGAKALNVGVAAHITAASDNGPRFDPTLTPEQRRHPDNGIWMCQNHGKLIDNDETQFTVALLLQWKHDAEQRALQHIGMPDAGSTELAGVAAVLREQLRDQRRSEFSPLASILEEQLATANRWYSQALDRRYVSVFVAPYTDRTILLPPFSRALEDFRRVSPAAYRRTKAAFENLGRFEGTVSEVRQWLASDFMRGNVGADIDYFGAISGAAEFLATSIEELTAALTEIESLIG